MKETKYLASTLGSRFTAVLSHAGSVTGVCSARRGLRKNTETFVFFNAAFLSSLRRHLFFSYSHSGATITAASQIRLRSFVTNVPLVFCIGGLFCESPIAAWVLYHFFPKCSGSGSTDLNLHVRILCMISSRVLWNLIHPCIRRRKIAATVTRERESFVTMFVVVELALAVVAVEVAEAWMLQTPLISTDLTCF